MPVRGSDGQINTPAVTLCVEGVVIYTKNGPDRWVTRVTLPLQAIDTKREIDRTLGLHRVTPVTQLASPCWWAKRTQSGMAKLP